MGMESSLDPDVTCDVQMSKYVLPETCSVLEARVSDALCRETMKAWHHLWHSLGATESQTQGLILPIAEICTKRQKRQKYGLQASRHHSKQSGSSPLDKYDLVTPSQ